ncbi:hypothetical protein VCB98_11395 [Gammaproteobacteria bacterium AB-CW1]|uniref:Uncharacterized protein n=1 Tax=Natronospira elongata TaxID=3110268 RepID=A0AAP6JJ70_9GAMM|nr:hypothetical protein [Gammaproteobacteria bacterium AB-CW1]
MLGRASKALIRRVWRCDRCGLQTPKKKSQCQHCHGLDEAGLAALKQRYEEKHITNARIGRVFLILSVLMIALMIIAFW